MDAFEKDFGQFIDSLKYDEFEGILFNLVRDALSLIHISSSSTTGPGWSSARPPWWGTTAPSTTGSPWEAPARGRASATPLWRCV